MSNINGTEEKRNNSHGEELGSLNLVEKQLKILSFVGMVPPDNKIWFYKVHTAIYAIIIINYIPTIGLIIGALPRYWGNVGMMTEIIFQFIICLNACIIGTYFTLNRNKCICLFQMIDTHFMKFINNIVTPTNRATIITRIAKQSKTFTNVIVLNIVFVMIIWSGMPFIMRTIDKYSGKTVDENDTQIHKYFCAVTWVPKGLSITPTYEIFITYQSFTVLVVISHYNVCNMIFFFFMFYTAAHFELLLSCIEDIDTKFPDECINDFDKMKTEDCYVHNQELPGMTNWGLMDNTELLIPVEEHTNKSKIIGTKNEKSVLNQPRVTEKLSYAEEAKLNHLIKCIKYHQALLEYSEKIAKFLSPMFLIYFICSEALMCLSVFQLAVTKGGGILKFIIGVLNVCTWPLIICLCAEYFSDKSKAVEEAIYFCRWYNHSTKFKKMLHLKLMRAQKPVKLSAGKFFDVSLLSFGEIINKVFAYFTIIMRMYQS